MKKTKTNGKTKTKAKAAPAKRKPAKPSRRTSTTPSRAAAAPEVRLCGRYYSLPPMRAVTCQCDLPYGHAGTAHRGVDKKGKVHEWNDVRDADARLRAGESVLLEDVVRDRDAKKKAKEAKKAANGNKPSERLARGETVASHELDQEQKVTAAANAPQTSQPAGTTSSTPFSAPVVPDPDIFRPMEVKVGARVIVQWGPGTQRRGVVDRFTRNGDPVVRMERVDTKGETTGELGSEGRTFQPSDIVGVIHPTLRHSMEMPVDEDAAWKRHGRLSRMTSDDINDLTDVPGEPTWERDTEDKGGIKRMTGWSTLIASTATRDRLFGELEAVGAHCEFAGSRLRIIDYVPNHAVPQKDHDATVSIGTFPITKVTQDDPRLKDEPLQTSYPTDGTFSRAADFDFEERIRQVFEMSKESINDDIAEDAMPVDWQVVTIDDDIVTGWIAEFSSPKVRDQVIEALRAVGYKCTASERGIQFWIEIVGRDMSRVEPRNVETVRPIVGNAGLADVKTVVVTVTRPTDVADAKTTTMTVTGTTAASDAKPRRKRGELKMPNPKAGALPKEPKIGGTCKACGVVFMLTTWVDQTATIINPPDGWWVHEEDGGRVRDFYCANPRCHKIAEDRTAAYELALRGGQHLMTDDDLPPFERESTLVAKSDPTLPAVTRIAQVAQMTPQSIDADVAPFGPCDWKRRESSGYLIGWIAVFGLRFARDQVADALRAKGYALTCGPELDETKAMYAGTTWSIRIDGRDEIRTMTITDPAQIEAVKSGTRPVSVGYDVKPTIESAATDPVLQNDQLVASYKKNPRTIPDGHPLLYTAQFSMERRRRALEAIEKENPTTPVPVGVPAHDASRLEDETRRREEAMTKARGNADVIDPSRVVHRTEADDAPPPWDTPAPVVNEERAPWE